MSPDDGADMTQYVTEILTDLLDELESRFPKMDDLAERDRLAVASAVGKAAWRGMLRGVAAYAHAVNEQAPQVHIQAWIHRPEGDEGEPDLWADRYGEASGDEA